VKTVFQSLLGVPVSVPFGVPDFPGLKFIAMYRLKGGVPVFMSTSSKGMGNEKAYVPAIGHTHLPRFIGSVGKAAETGTREHGQLTLSASTTSGVHVSSQAEIETGTLEHTSRPALFVSTGLDFWATERPYVFARDVQVDDIAYRRLDPEYFAWLRSRMVAVRAALDSGRVTAAAFEELRQSFWAVQEWALDTFGEATLRGAISRLDAAVYRPPVPEPSEPRSRPTRPAR
jgi:hypothetical protein